MALALAFAIPDRSNAVAGETPGTIFTITGHGRGDGGSPGAAALHPSALSFDADGALYVSSACYISRIASNIIRTVAGSGMCGNTGDGGPATSARITSSAVAEHGGDLYIADGYDCVVRRVRAGVITRIAGTGV